MNVVILTGRVSSDITIHYTQKGTAVVNFDIAVQRSFAKREDGKYPPSDFHHIVAWNKLAETCQKNLIKGRRVGVRGALCNDTYNDKDGNRKYKTFVTAEIVEFLDYRKSNPNSQQNFSQETLQEQEGQEVPQETDMSIYNSGIPDEEIPF